MTKIATVDNEAMNSLFAGEYEKMAGVKVAQGDDKGAPHDPQAFTDHEEYLSTVTSVLKEDAGQSFEPNDALKD